jgi:hypothetical protein
MGHTQVGQLAAGLTSALQPLPVAGQRRAQAAFGALHLAQIVARPHRQVAHTTPGLPLSDHLRQGVLGVGEPAGQPVRHRQVAGDLRGRCCVGCDRVRAARLLA